MVDFLHTRGKELVDAVIKVVEDRMPLVYNDKWYKIVRAGRISDIHITLLKTRKLIERQTKRLQK